MAIDSGPGCPHAGASTDPNMGRVAQGRALWIPRRNNGLTGGWWHTATSSEVQKPVYGPPGVGEANAGFHQSNPFTILSVYPMQEPMGAAGCRGGTNERDEDILDAGPWTISTL